MRQKLLSITRKHHLPSICVLCKQFHASTKAVCLACIALLPRLGQSCQQCAYPLADTKYPLCGHCIKKPPFFDTAIVPHPFEEPLRRLLHQFKYQHALYLSSFLSQLLLDVVCHLPEKPECLIPVPMHPKRLKERGFNQTLILTRLLAKALEIPYDFKSCQKIKNTEPQASLAGKQREKNLRKAFQADPLPYQHLVIIDDLLTTGSTANELARTLKQVGAQRVDIWCIARTLNKKNGHHP